MNYNNYYFIDSQYFPVVNCFNYSYKSKYIILCECDNFEKLTFFNRCVVAGSNGLINLSVPVVHGREQKGKYNSVRISYAQNWQMNHWRTIISCYRKSPFFNYYVDELEMIFLKRFDFLFDLNLSILHWINELIEHPAEIKVLSAPFDRDDFPGTFDLRKKWLPKNFQAESDFIRYTQVFEDRIGFQPNISILDLLFNTGPMAKVLLQNAETKKK